MNKNLSRGILDTIKLTLSNIGFFILFFYRYKNNLSIK